MNSISIKDTITRQRDFFNKGGTRDLSFRVDQLKKLKVAIDEKESHILQALKADMNKPPFEAYASEIGLVIKEINCAIKHLKSWARPKRVSTPMVHLPARSIIACDPYGVSLIIGPWNYPFQLVLSPLVGAVAAGNCAVVKPSELSPHTSRVIAQIIAKAFDPAHVTAMEGGVEATRQLLAEKFDYLFFTGGTAVGRVVMEAAAKNLTPLTLELGGKSPTIVEDDARIDYAARRIVWGKFFNAGQTCLAPDYLLVNRRVSDEFLKTMQKYILEFYGAHPQKSPDYARIINERHFDRITGLLKEGNIIYGGQTDRKDLFIAPTLVGGVAPGDRIMQEEIFGPLFPVVEYGELSEAISFVNRLPKPLALYFFSRSRKKQKRVLAETASGGGCINDTILHVGNSELPFGGVGDSGIGNYHGKASFETFSHKKGFLKKSLLIDISLRYPPYRNSLKWLKWILR